MNKFFGLTASVLMMTCVSAFAARPTTAEVTVFVGDLSNRIITTLKDNSNNLSARQQAFEDIFRQHGDVPKIAQFVSGKAWNNASDADKQTYVEAYRQYMAFTYAARITSYDNQTVKVGRVNDIGTNGFMVQTQIINPAQPQPLNVTWQLSSVNDVLKVTDLRIENISMSLTQRAEFEMILMRNDYKLSALTSALNSRVQK